MTGQVTALGGRRGLAAAVAIGLVIGLGACTSSPPGPEAAAKAFAGALTTGDFGDVTLTGSTSVEAAAQWAGAFEGLAPMTPAVQVQEIATSDDAVATATLAFTWDVDSTATDWTYTTHAQMTRVDDEWQIAWNTATLAPDLAAEETLGVRSVRGPRADVTTVDGTPIVQERDVLRIGIDKANIEAGAQDAAARALATALGYSAEGVEEYAVRVGAAGAKAFVEAIVVRMKDPDIAKYQATTQLDGVLAVADTLPLAPSRRFARPILGTVGEATAEIIEASDGAVAAGDLTGLSGLQRAYDEQLRGLPGLVVTATWSADAAGGAVPQERVLFRSDPVAGTPLVVTLDPTLQDAAEGILAGVTPASAIVAIRPSTGDVLVAASGETSGLSTATMGKYAPGSTFKVVSALALLRSGLTPDSELACPETTRVDGRQFSNYPGYPADRLGQISLRTALASSCNTAFIGARDSAEQSALAEAAASLGLDGGGDLGFPAYLGTVPGSAEGTEHAASMIGQGKVEASPLGMATVAASIAAGSRVTPRLVIPAQGAGTGTIASTSGSTPDATSAPVVPLTSAEAAALRDMMRAMVTEGSGDFLLDVPGAEVMAKSGTAQFGPQDDLRNHVWMIAIQGDLAVAVFVDEGDFGTTTSGPLLELFLQAAGAVAAP